MRAALAAGIALTVLVAVGGPASAHAAFVASQPEPGSELATVPGVVQLRFTEPLITELSSVTVTDPLGRTFRGGPTGDRRLQVDIDSSAPGPYTVRWKTVSPLDGHTLTGSYQFGVGADVGVQAEPSTDPSLADLAVAGARTVEYVGLLGALGLLTLAALADGTGLTWRPRGLHRWVTLAAVGGLVTVASEIVLASSGSLRTAASGLLAAPTGRARLVRLVLELSAVGVAGAAAHRSGTGRVELRPARALTGLSVMAALAALAAAGHAAASSYGVWMAAGHLWTAGVWAGTILVMGVHRPPGGWHGDPARALVREFAPIAAAAFGTTVAFGLVRGVQELGSPRELWTSAYGQVLAFKTLLVVAMAVLSGHAWRRARHHPHEHGGLAIAVVVLAAILVAFPVPPGRGDDHATAEAATDTSGLPTAGDLALALPADDTIVGLATPAAQAGIHDVFIHLVPPGGDQTEEIEVSLTVDGRPADVRRCGPACRSTTAALEAGTVVRAELSGPPGSNGTATFTIPSLPPPDASRLVTTMRERMDQLRTVRYAETLAPGDPPITSTWELAFPDRIHGIVHPPRFREMIRIDDRWWTRDQPDGSWTEAPSSGNGLSVRADVSLWDVTSTNHHVIGTETVDGVPTQIVAFFARAGQLPVWYRLWIDDDHHVRRAVMLAQGHIMEQHYDDFNAPLTIQPPE